MGNGGQCQSHAVPGPRCAGGLRRDGAAVGGSWRPAVPSQCHVRGAGGAGWLLCRLPSLLRARPRAGPEGWQRPGALPARTGPPDLGQVPRTAFGPLPAPGVVWGLGVGPAGAAERDEGRFLKLYFSAGSFRVNELTS